MQVIKQSEHGRTSTTDEEKKLFETITMKSKRKYYSEKLLQFQGDAKKTGEL